MGRDASAKSVSRLSTVKKSVESNERVFFYI